jgi:hypothetical protein
MTTKLTDRGIRSNNHIHLRNPTASVLTITALVFAAYGILAVLSPASYMSPLQAAYAQDGQQQQQSQGQSSSSAIMDKATSLSAAVDATLRYYARGIGAQYVETDIRPIAGAENINALEDVTIPSVPVGNTQGNTTGITSMGDYLIATGLIDKSYELFLETAREMRNVTVEDVSEIQTSLLQLHTLIDERAPYNLPEDVVQNLQGHLQRTVGITEEFTSGTEATTTTADTASTPTSEDTTTAETGTTDDTATSTAVSPSPLM